MENKDNKKKPLSLEAVQQLVNELQPAEKQLVTDGYHSFQELYNFRKLYNAALFNEWAKSSGFNEGFRIDFTKPKYNVHKSWKHHDGELCFGGDWFVVVAILPDGQITNHYHKDDWDLFNIPEHETALYPYDNHTSQDVLTRLTALIAKQ